MLQARDRQILHIALPSIVSNITVPLLGLIDVAITGHLGSSAFIGAIAVGGMLFNIIYWMFAFLRMGTSGMTAQARGRRDFVEIKKLLVRSLGIALAFSLLMLALSPLIREGSLMFIAPSTNVAQLTRTYFNICIFGAPASLMLFALNGWFIGMQNSRTPMFCAILQNVVNIIASLCFVFVLGMKVEGVALGTVVAQWCGCLTALFILSRYYKRILVLSIHDAADRVRSSLSTYFGCHALAGFFSVNRDIFIRTLCLIAIHFFFISAGAKLGDTELAVNTILMQFFTLYSYFMDGFAFAGEALAGKAYGARDEKTFHSVVRRLFCWGGMTALLFTLAYAVAGKSFLALLTDDATVIDAAMNYQFWTLLFPVCGMAAFVWDGVFIGMTATRQMVMSTFFGAAIFFVLYLTLFPTLHNHGLWIAYNANLFMRGLVLTVAHLRHTYK